MPPDSKQIPLKCIFCGSTELTVPEGSAFEKGTVVTCCKCENENEFSKLVEHNQKEFVELVKNDLRAEIEEIVKDSKILSFKK